MVGQMDYSTKKSTEESTCLCGVHVLIRACWYVHLGSINLVWCHLIQCAWILNISAWTKKDWNWIFTHYFSSIYTTMHWESTHIRLLYQSSQIVLMNENKPKLSSFQMAYLERLLCLNSDVNLKVKYDSGIVIETILRVWTEDAFILLDPQVQFCQTVKEKM